MRQTPDATDGVHVIIEFPVALPPMVYEASTAALLAVATAHAPEPAQALSELGWALCVLRVKCGHRFQRFDTPEQAARHLSAANDVPSQVALALLRRRYPRAA